MEAFSYRRASSQATGLGIGIQTYKPQSKSPLVTHVACLIIGQVHRVSLPAFHPGDAAATCRPERWTDPKNKKSLELHQHPFGWGTHSCLGYRIARATAAAVAQELSRAYSMSADTNTTFSDFPTGGRPVNALPITLKPLAA